MATYFGKEYTNIGTESNPVWQAAGGGGGGSGSGAAYSTGWLTSTPDAFTNVTYTHNLGTEDIVHRVYVRDNAGNEHNVTNGEWFLSGNYGSEVVDITSTQITIKFLTGYLDWPTASSGANPLARNWSVATHIKVVVRS